MDAGRSRNNKTGLQTMTAKKTIDIRVNGYVCEIVCGEIPIPAREAVARHLIENRVDAHVPEWMKKRYPNHVNPDAVKDLWYDRHDVMSGIMTSCGVTWTGYRDVNGFCLIRGFGTGKRGHRAFLISRSSREGERVAGFLPVEPTADMGRKPGAISRIRKVRVRGPPLSARIRRACGRQRGDLGQRDHGLLGPFPGII